MKVTNAEKLIIGLLAEIHEKLGIQNGIDSKFVQNALYDDHTWAIPWVLPGVFGDTANDEEIPDEVSETSDILSMWDIVEYNLQQMEAEGQQKIRDKYRFVEFFGFDGNNEAQHLSVARFLIHEMGRFQQFKDRELNSHMPTLSIYRPMVKVHKSLKSYGNNDPAGIMKILAVHSK